MSKKDNFGQAMYDMFGIGGGSRKRSAGKSAQESAAPRDPMSEDPIEEVRSIQEEPKVVPKTAPVETHPVGIAQGRVISERTVTEKIVPERTTAGPNTEKTVQEQPRVAEREIKPEIKPEVKPEIKPEVKPEIKPEYVPASQPENYIVEPEEEFQEVIVYEKSYIAAGVYFEGNLQTKGDIEIAGEIKGDITSEGVITLLNKVEGNIVASDLIVIGTELKGNVAVSGTVDMDSNASVLGNIQADNINCAGNIKGDLKASDNVSIGNSAVIRGSISAATMSVMRGAKISGRVALR